MKIVILVVIYDKQIDKSTTIDALIKNGVKNAHLVIHNNGPSAISLSANLVSELFALGVTISLVNCLENKPLSNLYNDFIDEFLNYERFVLLDDDSLLTQSYIKSFYSDSYDIELPRIVSIADKKTYYPISNGKIINSNTNLNAFDTFSIGSGLILTRNFIDKYLKRNLNVFDENYAFYGVDISLFRRMWRLQKQGESFEIKTSSTIYHSLSRTEGPESLFRRKERLIDYAVSTRRYPSLRGYASLIKKGMKQLATFNIDEFFLMVSCFLSGMHPRSKLWNASRKLNTRK